MKKKHTPDRLGEVGIDANGCLTHATELDGQSVVIHYDDVPETDITTVHGLRVTTPLRTVIDLAAELNPRQLDEIIEDFMGRGLFTLDDVRARLDQPDMATRPGASILRRHLVF